MQTDFVRVRRNSEYKCDKNQKYTEKDAYFTVP